MCDEEFDEERVVTFLRRVLTAAELEVVRGVAGSGGLRAALGVSWRTLVGAKAVKAIASDLAFRAFPDADTARLTTVVANVSAHHALAPLGRRHGFGGVDGLTHAIALVAEALGLARAAALLVPEMLETARRARGLFDVAHIIGVLLPERRLGDLDVVGRVELVRDELRRRGVDVRPPRVDGDAVTSGDSDSETDGGGIVDVYQAGQLAHSVPVVSGDDARAVVLAEAREYIARCRAEGRQLAGAAAVGGVAAAGRTQHVRALDELEDDERHAFMRWAMNATREVLRLRPHFVKYLEERGLLEAVVASAGWVPLREVVAELVCEHEARVGLGIEAPSEQLVEQLLDEHDALQRFEVGECALPGAFQGQRCARALYAHFLPVAAKQQPLFERILRSFGEPSPPLAPGWMLFDLRNVKRFAAKGLRLFDNNALVTVVAPESLQLFVDYCRRHETHKYDDKLSQPELYFLEVDLALAAADASYVVLRRHPARGSLPGHFVLLPFGAPRLRRPALPLAYLTGRYCLLSRDGVKVGDAALPSTDPNATFAAGELEALRARARAAGGSAAGEVTAAALPALRFDTPAGESSAVAEPRLDVAALKDIVCKFHADGSRTRLLLEVPKTGSGGHALYGRTQAVRELKEFIVSLGLRHAEQPPARRGGDDRILVSKRCTFPDALVPAVAAELEIVLQRPELLRCAFTREGEDAGANYERLEFIGDAVLDFVVAHDALVAGFGGESTTSVTAVVCNNAVLGRLLPPALEAHVVAEYGAVLDAKVPADMFEAIVGAVYEDRRGLDAVRGVVARLFARLPAVLRSVTDSDLQTRLQEAARTCPYIADGCLALLQERFPLRTVAIVDGVEPLESSGSAAPRRFEAPASHQASVGFPRIQDKEFATHFTTGPVPSYRRVVGNVARVFNRILQLFQRGTVAYTNETLGTVTTLALDFDGVDVRFGGVRRVIHEWFRLRFGSRSMGLVLDCSGWSPSAKKEKRSCHIHFPQVSLSLEALRECTSELRAAVARHFAAGPARRGCGVCPGHVVVATDGVLPLLGRVVLSAPLAAVDADTSHSGAVGRLPATAVYGALGFLDAVDAARAGAVSRALRRMAQARVVAALGADGVLVRPLLAPDFEAFPPSHDRASLERRGAAVLRVVMCEDDVATVARARGAKRTRGFFTDVVRPLLERDRFGAAAWEKTIDHGLVDSRKLRMFLCDKFDMKYGQEYRPLLLQTVLAPPPLLPELAATADGDSAAEAELPHAAVLRLTSLRCPTFRDARGAEHSAWDAEAGEVEGQPLPSFDDYRRSSPAVLRSDDWTVLVGGVFEAAVTTDGATGAVLPCWWQHDAGRAAAVLRVAGEPMWCAPGATLRDALAAPSGMAAAMRRVVPHAEVVAPWSTPIGDSALLLSGRIPAKAPPGVAAAKPATAAAPSAPTVARQTLRHGSKRFVLLDSDGDAERHMQGAWVSTLFVAGTARAFAQLVLRGEPFATLASTLHRPGRQFEAVVIDADVNASERVLDCCASDGTVYVVTAQQLAALEALLG